MNRVLNAGTEFVACDNPAANPLTLHILAAVAEAEAKAISERMKGALAAYKTRGWKLGAELPQCRNLTRRGHRQGPQALRRGARSKPTPICGRRWKQCEARG